MNETATLLVSPQWRPHLLAASVHFLHGNQGRDFPAVQQARDALYAHLDH